MKSLRILFLIDSLGTGGAERDLAERLPRLGHYNIVPIIVSLRRRQEGVQQDLQAQGFDIRFLNGTNLISSVLGLHRIIRTAGVVERLPGNNTSYKRSLLLEYDSQLEEMMETEAILHRDFRRKGLQLYLEPAAQLAHLNFELLSSFLSIRLLSGRVFGAARARGPLLRRLAYVFATPLIPLVRYRRIVRRLGPSRKRFKMPRGVMPVMLCGLLVSACGELIGCCCGGGRAKEKRAKFEFNRLPHLARLGKSARAVEAAPVSKRRN